VRAVDAQAVDGLLRAVQATALIGAKAVLTGIRPEIATTLVEIEANLSGVVTFGSLETGIAYAMQRVRTSRSLR
jgi:rsbT co-antagonist protein RsbR